MSLREKLYAQPHTWEPMTPEEAFEAGKSAAKGKAGAMNGYSAAANAFARAILECADRHPEVWRKVHDMISESKKHSGPNWHGKGQDLLLDAMGLFGKEAADDEYRKEVNRIGPSGFQAGWAFQQVWFIMEAEGDV